MKAMERKLLHGMHSMDVHQHMQMMNTSTTPATTTSTSETTDGLTEAGSHNEQMNIVPYHVFR